MKTVGRDADATGMKTVGRDADATGMKTVGRDADATSIRDSDMNLMKDTQVASAEIVQIIEPSKGWIRVDWRELWRYRELFAFMVWRDVKIKYKQTLLGVAWAILVPFFQMIVFTVIFGRLANLSTNNLPGPVYYLCNLMLWTYFSTSLSMASQSMVGNERLLTKIYFPRLIVPTAPCLAALVDLLISFGILIPVLLWYGILPTISVLLLPLMVLIVFGTAAGVGFLLSALNVKYRDVRYVVPFLIQMWMYCTVIVPFSAIPERYGNWRYLYGLNPVAGATEGFRWCLLHHKMTIDRVVGEQTIQVPVEEPWILLAIGIPVMLINLAVGLYYFKRMESQFADIV